VKFSVDPADTSYSRDMIALVRRGDVEGMSFGMMNQGLQFTAVKENGQNIRDVSAFVYDEITFTSIPAFTGTSVSSEFAAKEEPTAEPTVEKPVDILQSKPEPVATPLRNKMSIERKREELRNILSK
jgi:phage head maturation protease